MKRIFFIALVAGLSAAPAFAQDEGLYPEPSAPDASFVRVYAGPTENVSVQRGQSLDQTANGLTEYTEIRPGPVVIRIGPNEYTIEAGASEHYTFVPASTVDESVLLTDAVTNAPGEANLIFYNFTDLEAVDLFVPEAGVVAVSPVGPGQGAGVALRAPLTLGFVARFEGQDIAQAPSVAMRPRTGTSLVITGNAGAYVMRDAPNVYDD